MDSSDVLDRGDANAGTMNEGWSEAQPPPNGTNIQSGNQSSSAPAGANVMDVNMLAQALMKNVNNTQV